MQVGNLQRPRAKLRDFSEGTVIFEVLPGMLEVGVHQSNRQEKGLVLALVGGEHLNHPIDHLRPQIAWDLVVLEASPAVVSELKRGLYQFYQKIWDRNLGGPHEIDDVVRIDLAQPPVLDIPIAGVIGLGGQGLDPVTDSELLPEVAAKQVLFPRDLGLWEVFGWELRLIRNVD